MGIDERYIAVLAGSFTLMAFGSQIYTSYVTKDTRGLSMGLLLFSLASLLLWTYYGHIIKKDAHVVMHILMLIFVLILIDLKLLYG